MSKHTDFLQWQESHGELVKNSIETMLPAKIISYNNVTKRASVKILVSLSYDDMQDEYIDIPVLNDVPVGIPVGGGFVISMPLQEGDTGRICIFSKDIDSYKSYGGKQKVINESKFYFSNSIFIPDFHPFSEDIGDLPPESLYIGKMDETIGIQINPNKSFVVKRDGENLLEISEDKTVSINNLESNISINPSGNIEMKSPKTTIDSDVDLEGNLKINYGYTGLIHPGSIATVVNGIITQVF